MHDSKHVGGFLADIDMVECRFLSVQVVPRIREDKRASWKAAVELQTEWRRVTMRRWWLVLRSTAIHIQGLMRMWPVRQRFLEMRAGAILIEATIKMVLTRWPFLRWIVSSRVVQRIVRGHAGRARAYAQLLARRKLLQARLSAPVKIQCLWRAYLAYRVVLGIRRHDHEEFMAALKLQLNWYVKQDNFSTFVLLGCLREKDQDERDMKRHITKMYRVRNVIRIQREVRRHIKERHLKASLSIQCAWRGYVNTVS